MTKIGITTYMTPVYSRDCNVINMDYIGSITEEGALPILMPLTEDRAVLDQYLNLIEGLLLTGGDDLDPKCYGEENQGLSKQISALRDSVELYCIEKAIERKLPILGICRGLQILNVYFGGTLVQDIPSQMETTINHQNKSSVGAERHHEVDLIHGSTLHDIVGQDSLQVNSRHHQCIKVLGRDFKIAAKAPDGIIEAIEMPEKNILAVQWHPENLRGLGQSYKAIFDHFVSNASAIR